MKRKFLRFSLFSVLGLFLVFVVILLLPRKKYLLPSGKPVQALYAGDHLPLDLSLESLDGKHSITSDYVGKTLLLNYWASWCAPCMHEMPDIYEIQKKYLDRGLVVLSVDMDEDPLNGEKLLTNKFGAPPFPILNGLTSELAHSFQSKILPGGSLPVSVLIDKRGVVRYTKFGGIDLKLMLQKVEELL